ncbi:MAG: hypothetical protein R3E10_08245 [Gemmatimonadota bacterium]
MAAPTSVRIATFTTLAIASALFIGACSSDEVGPEDEHDPVSVTLHIVGGAELTPNVVLAAGQTVQVEARFYDDEGTFIEDLEDEHFAAFVFSPADLATTTPVAGRTFAFAVTARATPGTGTITVDWGHDEDVDERSFGPFSVTVQ